MDAQGDIIKLPKGKLDFSNGSLLMGILNVTPDSFSDGGKFVDGEKIDVDKAVQHAMQMVKNGAAIIDVGPESTRPAAVAVSIEKQIEAAIPVIKLLAEKTDVPISIDTHYWQVAEAAIETGAVIINDVTAMADENMRMLAAKTDVAVVLMHMQGEPQNMQNKPTYENVVNEIRDFLLEKAKKAEQSGVASDRIFIDPGIGFGKTLEHNVDLMKNLNEFVKTPYRVLLGTSRKNFIGQLTNVKNPADRGFGTAATVAVAIKAGVSILRVHDVKQMAEVVKVTEALK